MLKKVLAIFCAAVMVVGMTVPSYAEPSPSEYEEDYDYDEDEDKDENKSSDSGSGSNSEGSSNSGSGSNTGSSTATTTAATTTATTKAGNKELTVTSTSGKVADITDNATKLGDAEDGSTVTVEEYETAMAAENGDIVAAAKDLGFIVEEVTAEIINSGEFTSCDLMGVTADGETKVTLSGLEGYDYVAMLVESDIVSEDGTDKVTELVLYEIDENGEAQVDSGVICGFVTIA